MSYRRRDFGPGKIRVLWEAECANCGDCQTSFAQTKTDAAKDLRADGWRKTTAEGWMCPFCIEALRNE